MIGQQLLHSFCDLSASEKLFMWAYLETPNPLNVRFYERAGFAVTAHGRLGSPPSAVAQLKQYVFPGILI